MKDAFTCVLKVLLLQMDILRPPTVWIGGSCYRLNPGDEPKENEPVSHTGDTADAYEEEHYYQEENEGESTLEVVELEPGEK